MNSQSLRSMAMVVLAAALWGTTGTAQSFAPPQLSSYWVGTLRLVVAAAFFWPLLWLQGRTAESSGALRHLPWRGIWLAGASMCVYNLAFFAGVRSTGVAVGTALALGSGPVWAGVLQFTISRKFPSRTWWLGTAVAVVGVAVMATSNASEVRVAWPGVLLCLLAGLSYATYALANQRLVRVAAPAVVTTTVFTLAALLAVPAAIVLAGVPQLHVQDVAIVVWLGVVSTGFAYLLFSHALRHIPAATGVVLSLGEPVTAFVLAIVVVGEKPGAGGAIGLAAVLVGLLIVVRGEYRPGR